MRPTAAALLFTFLLSAQTPAQGGVLYLDPMFGVQRTNNIIYGQGLVDNGASTIDLKLDFYQPTDIGTPLEASRPTMMYIHGGSWQGGDKGSFSQANVWASRGYNVISINYRLLGDNPPPTSGAADEFALIISLFGPAGLANTVNASIQDAQLALEWLYDNAVTYGVDVNRIGVSGNSAGAINALALTYLAPSEHVQPKAVVSSVGALPLDPLIFSERFEAGDPPAFLTAGANDSTVPAPLVEHTSFLMSNAGVYNELYVQPATGHTTNWNLNIGGATISQHAIDFLATHLAAVPEPSSLILTSLVVVAAFLARRR